MRERRTRAFGALVVALLAVYPGLVVAQQAPPAENKPVQAAAPAKTEADKKLDAILKAGDADRVKLVEQLEAFIAENATYPKLQNVYRSLVSFASPTAKPEKAIAIADLAVAKYPDDVVMRANAVRLKIRAFQAQKNDAAVNALAQKLIETETSAYVLETAATWDRAGTLRLLDKAITERGKNPSRTASPTVSDLQWAYAKRLLDDGDCEKALERVALAEQTGEDAPLEAAAAYAKLRAEIYAKMGKPDLELESYARAFSARIDTATRDKIRELAPKNGRKPEEVFAQAREYRKQNAVAISPFELKATDATTLTLDTVRAKAKVTIVNFFFPT